MQAENNSTQESILPHKIEVPCERCFSRDKKQLYKDLTNVVRCNFCGYIYTFPQPSRETLKKFYDEAYFKSSRSVTKGYDDYIKDETNIRKTFEKRYRKFIEPLGIKHGSVLDVGSAAGFFLDVMKSHGWNTEGVEISEFCARYATEKGHRVFNGHLKEFKEKQPKQFDIVTLWDCLEHVPSVRETMLHVNQLTKMGGYIFIAAPAVDSLVAHFFKSNWIGFKEGEHLHFFRFQDLKTFLNDYGYRIKTQRYIGKYLSYDLFKRRLAQYSRPLSRFVRKYLSGPRTKNLGFYLNPWDIRMVVAEKVMHAI